jgi:anti-sigma regulatory factor (Ser/Thr protein kinase)
VLDGVAENVVLARAFAAATLHVLEASDDHVADVRLIVSELVTALITDGVGQVVIDVVDGDPPTMRVGSEGALPDLSSPVNRIVEASLGVGLDIVDGRWLIPLRVFGGEWLADG